MPKTTKAVREAPTASRDIPVPWDLTMEDQKTIMEALSVTSYNNEKAAALFGRLFDAALPKPRYTVELTTEGWQIKDNVKGTIGAEFWTSSSEPEGVCNRLNRADAAEGQGRR